MYYAVIDRKMYTVALSCGWRRVKPREEIMMIEYVKEARGCVVMFCHFQYSLSQDKSVLKHQKFKVKEGVG